MTAVGGLGHAPVPDSALLDRHLDRHRGRGHRTLGDRGVQNRYMDTPFWRAALQVVLGGSLVFAAGILIGNA
jgi:hypothetical protein